MNIFGKSEYIVEVCIESLTIKVSFDCDVCFLIQHGRVRLQTRAVAHDRRRGPINFPPETVRIPASLDESGSIALFLQLQVSAQGKSKQGGCVSVKFPPELGKKQSFRCSLEQCPDPTARVDYSVTCRPATENEGPRRADSLKFNSVSRMNASHSPSANVTVAFSKTNIFQRADTFGASSGETGQKSTTLYEKFLMAKTGEDRNVPISSRLGGKAKFESISEFRHPNLAASLNASPAMEGPFAHTSLKPKLFQPGLTTSLVSNTKSGRETSGALSVSTNLINPAGGLEKTSTVLNSAVKARNLLVSFNDKKAVQSSTQLELSSPPRPPKDLSPNMVRALLTQKKTPTPVPQVGPQLPHSRTSITNNSEPQALKILPLSDKKRKPVLKQVNLRKIFERASTFVDDKKKDSLSAQEAAEKLQASLRIEFDSQLDQLTRANADLSASLALRTQENKKLEEELENLKRHQELDSESAKNEQFQVQLKIHQLEQTWQAEKETLLRQLETAQKLACDAQAAQTVAESLSLDATSKLDELQTALQQTADQLKTAKLQNSALENQIADSRRQHLEEANAMLEKIAEINRQKVTESIQSLGLTSDEADREKIEALSEHVQNLEEQLRSERAATKNLSEQLMKFNSDIGELRERSEAFAKTNAGQTEEIELLHGEIERSSKRLKIMEAKNTEYERMNKENTAKEKRMTNQILDMHKEIHRLTDEVSTHELALKTAQEEQVTYQTKYHSLLQTIDEAVNSLKSSSIKHEVKQRLLEVLTASLSA